jgi:hypothetical protein
MDSESLYVEVCALFEECTGESLLYRHAVWAAKKHDQTKRYSAGLDKAKLAKRARERRARMTADDKQRYNVARNERRRQKMIDLGRRIIALYEGDDYGTDTIRLAREEYVARQRESIRTAIRHSDEGESIQHHLQESRSSTR